MMYCFQVRNMLFSTIGGIPDKLKLWINDRKVTSFKFDYCIEQCGVVCFGNAVIANFLTTIFRCGRLAQVFDRYSANV